MVSDPTVTFSGRRVTVGAQTWDAPWPVKQAAAIGDRLVLLYDFMAGPKDRQFRNLEAFTIGGEHLWTAEHPTSGSEDCYVEILTIDPLVAWDFACYRCTIQPSNGRLIEAQFVK